MWPQCWERSILAGNQPEMEPHSQKKQHQGFKPTFLVFLQYFLVLFTSNSLYILTSLFLFPCTIHLSLLVCLLNPCQRSSSGEPKEYPAFYVVLLSDNKTGASELCLDLQQSRHLLIKCTSWHYISVKQVFKFHKNR